MSRCLFVCETIRDTLGVSESYLRVTEIPVEFNEPDGALLAEKYPEAIYFYANLVEEKDEFDMMVWYYNDPGVFKETGVVMPSDEKTAIMLNGVKNSRNGEPAYIFFYADLTA